MNFVSKLWHRWKNRKAIRIGADDVCLWNIVMRQDGKGWVIGESFRGTYDEAKIESQHRTEVHMYHKMVEGGGVQMCSYGVELAEKPEAA